MVEIELTVAGKYAFEYQTQAVPRVGEYLDIKHETFNGVYQVEKVVHRIFQDKDDKDSILSYVKVYAKA